MAIGPAYIMSTMIVSLTVISSYSILKYILPASVVSALNATIATLTLYYVQYLDSYNRIFNIFDIL